MYELYLAHHGILGMKWGLRRYQNKDGSLTPAGKNRYAGPSNPRHKPSNAKKLAKQRAANLEKARKARAAKKAFEEGKKNALDRGNATELLKYKGHLTNQEMQAALNRLDNERRLSELSAKEVASGKKSFDKIMKKIDSARDAGEKMKNAWNFIADVHNSFADADNAWQKIGQPSEREKKEKRQKQQEEATAKKKKLADALKSGKITTDEFAKLSKIRENLTPTDIDELLKKRDKDD